MLAELKKLIEANPLFRDKLQPNGARAPSPVTNPLMGSVPKATGFPPLSAHGPFQPTPAALPTSLAGWMANSSPVPHLSASAGPISLNAANNAAMDHQTAMDYQTADSEHVLKRSRPFGLSEEVQYSCPIRCTFNEINLSRLRLLSFLYLNNILRFV